MCLFANCISLFSGLLQKYFFIGFKLHPKWYFKKFAVKPFNVNYCFGIHPLWIVCSFKFSACSEGYNLRRYPLLRKINSEVNEQQNAATKKLKSQLSYMNPDNFKNHCVLFILHRNQMKAAEKMKNMTLTLVWPIKKWNNKIDSVLLSCSSSITFFFCTTHLSW